jgi:predicted DNA-binding transcriptional regulator AlpA
MHPQTYDEAQRASAPVLDDDTLLNSAQTKARCGNVSDMCIWRWLRDERVQFPQPIKMNKRNYWRLGDLRAWLAKQTNKTAA